MNNEVHFNNPIDLEEAISRIASFNGERVEDELKRHPRMVGENVLEDDEDVYLLPNSEYARCPYLIPKIRLDEDDWVEHLSYKGWCDSAMLSDFSKIQQIWLKRQ